MKKLLIIASMITLSACQPPVERTVYQAVGPRLCFEYYDSFRCSAPTQTWHETIYPKNNDMLQYGTPLYKPYQPSLNRSIYGTYGN